jgi:hypothetical protein
MTGISLHMQWPLTSLSRGSFSQREQLFFVTDQTPPHNFFIFSVDQTFFRRKLIFPARKIEAFQVMRVRRRLEGFLTPSFQRGRWCEQGDQMAFVKKNRPKFIPTYNFSPKLIHDILSGNWTNKNLVYFRNFRKASQSKQIAR